MQVLKPYLLNGIIDNVVSRHLYGTIDAAVEAGDLETVKTWRWPIRYAHIEKSWHHIATKGDITMFDYFMQQWDFTFDIASAASKAASNGRLEMVKKMCSIYDYSSNIYSIKSIYSRIIRSAAFNDHLEIVKECFESELIDKAELINANFDMIDYVASKGYVEIVDYLIKQTNELKQLKPDKHDLEHVLKAAIIKDDLTRVKSIFSHTAISNSTLIKCLRIASYRGRDMIFQYLFSTKVITGKFDLFEVDEFIINAARGGHLEMAKYIFSMAETSPEFLTLDLQNSIFEAVRNGDLEMCKYLFMLAKTKVYTVMPTDIAASVNEAINTAIAYDKLDILKWLFNENSCQVLDTRREAFNTALMYSKSHNCLKWLVEQCYMTLEDAYDFDDDKTMREIILSNQLELIKWLHKSCTQFKLTEKSINSIAHYGSLETIRYFHEFEPRILDAIKHNIYKVNITDYIEGLEYLRDAGGEFTPDFKQDVIWGFLDRLFNQYRVVNYDVVMWFLNLSDDLYGNNYSHGNKYMMKNYEYVMRKSIKNKDSLLKWICMMGPYPHQANPIEQKNRQQSEMPPAEYEFHSNCCLAALKEALNESQRNNKYQYLVDWMRKTCPIATTLYDKHQDNQIDINVAKKARH